MVTTYLVAYVVASILAMLFFWRRYLSVKKAIGLTLPELENFIHKGAVFVDVRSLREWQQRHQEGIEHLPHDQMELLTVPKDEIVITFCNSGIRSSKAAEDLLGLGYKRVFYFSGHEKQVWAELGKYRSLPSQGQKCAEQP